MYDLCCINVVLTCTVGKGSMAAPMMSSAGKNLNSMMAREAGNKEKVVEKVVSP